MKFKPLPDKKVLDGLFSYNYETGLLSRKSSSGRTKSGVCSAKNPKGYVYTRVNGKRFFVHRIIWKMIKGKDSDQIDHINGINDDNRFCNLRSVTHHENQKNKRIRSNNISGVIGVYLKSKGWEAQLGVNNETIKLGFYDSKEDAIKARKLAEVKYGYHPNHGRKPPAQHLTED